MRVRLIDNISTVRCFLLCWIHTFIISSMNAQEITNIVPPSPNASSLGQYGEIPVSYYTGTPSINIPLYEAKGRHLSVSISLSYHASGIKVNQRPGDVGMGWALNAGGVITRTVVGKADEQSGLGYSDVAPMLADYLNNNMSPEESTTFLDRCAEGVYDTRPDIYHYNFMGHSGKMVFDQEGEIMFIPHQKMKVERNGSGGFDVTTDDGTKYFFNDTEESGTEAFGPDDPGEPEATTAWYLSKITSVTGDEINFTYSSPYVFGYNMYQGESQTITSGLTCQDSRVITLSESAYSVDKVDLIEVSTINATIKFIRDTIAAPGGQKNIKAIEVYDNQDITSPIKTFDFYYSNLDPYRPSLDSIQELSTLAAKPPYRFFYNAEELPDFDSKAQDHWGFYNGSISNTMLLPDRKYNNQTFDGAKREPDADYAMAGILETIHYPTGGKTVFDFEGHDYSGGVLSISIPESLSIKAEGDTTITTTFILPEGVDDLSLHVLAETPEWMQSEHGESVGDVYLEAGCNGYPYEFSFVSGGTASFNEELQPCGGETMTLRVTSLENRGMVKAVLSYQKPSGEYQRIFPGGGIRIRKISDYADWDGNQLTGERRFEYQEGNLSSGRLVKNTNYPSYEYTSRIMDTDNLWVIVCDHKVFTASNQSALGMTQGSHIGYSTVTVYQDDTKTSGKTVYEYTSPKDFGDGVDPYTGTVVSSDYKRGLQLAQTDFAYHGNKYKKIKKIENEYHFDETINSKLDGLGVRFQLKDDAWDKHSFYVHTYWHTSEWVYQSDKTETFFDINKPDSLVQTTTYIYDNNNHLQPTEILTSMSDGRSKAVEMKYADDLNDVTMSNAHMHSQVLESVTKIDGIATQKTTTQYNVEQGHIVPTVIQTYPDGGTENIKVDYEYNAYGNVVQVKKENGIVTSYLWGYNQTYPVAKIENSTYSSIPLDSITNIQSLSDVDDDHCRDSATCDEKALRTALNALRNVAGLSDALITTYTYDPLVGMTSQTDAGGRTIYYEYDDFGRLQRVRNQEEYILQELDYQYHSE